jgi:hypothetical protein
MSLSPQQQRHRRSSSDLPPPVKGQHRRMGSGTSSGNRARTMSSGSVGRKGQHRRQLSNSSVGTASSVRSTSNLSVRSNIAKSSMFGGVDETTGRVQMHFPFESVRLVFVEPQPTTTKQQQKDSQFKQGNLYMDGKTTDFEEFEEYTMITNAIEEGVQPQWESLDKTANMCGCACNNCNGCFGKQHLLPDPNYLLPVDPNIFKHMVGEISDAHAMPCGLFFCGHHEDVAHPSIAIAMMIVTILFLWMAYVAFVIEAS